MDLGAYARIGELEHYLEENNIEIPRLRGLRLMKDEEIITEQDFEIMYKAAETRALKDLICGYPSWSVNPLWYMYSDKSRRTEEYYMGKNRDTILWNRIHGKRRKKLKLKIKHIKKQIKEQYDLWNKYVGDSDVLYAHARLGGDNWSTYKAKDFISEEWFLSSVDDWDDGTYCDIYIKIKGDKND